MNPIKAFWNFFQQNNFAFLLINEIPATEITAYFKKLNDKLTAYNKDIGLIIKNGKSKSELIITAHGNPYLFKEIELLVHYAPTIERWKITAFLQPEEDLEKYKAGIDKPFDFYGLRLNISDMYFQPLQNQNKPQDLGICVYVNNYMIHKNNPKLREAVYLMIEHLIGEKSFANDLTFIDIDQYIESPVELNKLYELGLFIKKLKLS